MPNKHQFYATKVEFQHRQNTFKCTTCTSDQSVKELIERLNKELAGIPKPNSQTSETPYHPAKFKVR